MVLAIRHGRLPATLHVDRPSRNVDWSGGQVSLLREPVEWPATGRPRRAAVSSFGISGTNAHLILEQAPEEPVGAEHRPTDDMTAWVLSARSEPALRAQAARLAAHVSADPDLHPADVGLALAATRSQFEHRSVVIADQRTALLHGLSAIASGEPAPSVVSAAGRGGPVAFLCSGQGTTRPQMGRELHASFPAFAKALDELCDMLDPYLDAPLRDVMFAPAGSARAGLLEQTRYAQPALFALETALARLLLECGVRPNYLAGHSIGGLTAAHLAGVIDVADAAMLVAARGRLMQAARAGGAMVALQASEDEVLPVVAARRQELAVAAVNGPQAVVISGDADAVAQVEAQFRALGRKTRRLAVSHAFHSPHMDGALAEFRAVASGIRFAAPQLPVVSDTTGRLATAEELCSPDYWVEHLRQPVRFAEVVRTLSAAGIGTYLELGPDATLCGLTAAVLGAGSRTGDAPRIVPLLRTGRPETRTALTAVAEVHVAGAPVDWTVLFEGRGARPVPLPTYPFEHSRYWANPPASRTSPPAGGADTPFWFADEDSNANVLADLLGAGDAEREALKTVLPLMSRWRRSTASRYRVSWDLLPVAPLPAEPVRGQSPADRRFLLLTGDERELGAAVAAALTAAGATVQVAGGGPDEAGELLRGFDGVLSLTAEGLDRAADLGAPLWMITRDAWPVEPGSGQRTEPGLALRWAAGELAATGGLVDLPAVLDPATGRRLAEVLATPCAEAYALRGDRVFVRRLRRADTSQAAGTGAGERQWRPTGTVLVTGAASPAGRHAARWLVRGGAARLLLTVAPDTPAEQVATLQAEFAGVAQVLRCDPADRGAAADAVAAAGAEPGSRLTAVVCADGVGALAADPAAALAAAANLDELTRDLDLAAFVVFGPVDGLVGAGGDVRRAAVRAGLEMLVQRRPAAGLAVAWGPMGTDTGAHGGTAPQDDAGPQDDAEPGPVGVRPLSPALGMPVLADAADSLGHCAVVADIEWSAVPPRPLVTDLASGGEARVAAGRACAQRVDYAAMAPAERADALLDLVRRSAAEVLGLGSPDDLAPDANLLEAGFTSFAAIELTGRLRDNGFTLSPAALIDLPTARAIAQALPEPQR
jgi:acyl transferase domain-containing protein/aryl carrier-like protein